MIVLADSIIYFTEYDVDHNQWIYEDKYLVNKALGTVLTATSDNWLQALPKINPNTPDASQQWILDYNGLDSCLCSRDQINIYF